MTHRVRLEQLFRNEWHPLTGWVSFRDRVEWADLRTGLTVRGVVDDYPNPETWYSEPADLRDGETARLIVEMP